MRSITALLLFFVCSSAFGQEQRQLLRGKLMYRNSNVVAANVVNNSAQTNTITDENGEFEIIAGLGDEIIFSSVQFKIRTVSVTADILERNRLIVSVNERINVLDEIVVGPENTQKFLDLKKEEFTKVDYLQDKSTKIENNIMRQGELTNGLNIVNIAKLLAKIVQGKSAEEQRTLQPSKVLPQIFDRVFFTQELGLNAEEITPFLEQMDRELPTDRLLRKEREFQLIEYLYNASEVFKSKRQ